MCVKLSIRRQSQYEISQMWTVLKHTLILVCNISASWDYFLSALWSVHSLRWFYWNINAHQSTRHGYILKMRWIRIFFYICCDNDWSRGSRCTHQVCRCANNCQPLLVCQILSASCTWPQRSTFFFFFDIHVYRCSGADDASSVWLPRTLYFPRQVWSGPGDSGVLGGSVRVRVPWGREV